MTPNVVHNEPTRGFICVFVPFSSTINFHVPEHHQTNNLHDMSFYLVSPDLFVLRIWHSIFPISTSVIFSF